jgi:hypothetical protein
MFVKGDITILVNPYFGKFGFTYADCIYFFYIFYIYLYPFMYLLHILKLRFTAFLSSIYLPGDLRWGL